MTFPAFDPTSRPPGGASEGEHANAAGQPSANRALLDRVLEQTFRRLRAEDGLGEADAGALVDVARRRRGEPYSHTPVAIELVEAVLRDTLVRSVTPPPEFAALVAQVAQTIHDDDDARARLEKLWQALNEAPP